MFRAFVLSACLAAHAAAAVLPGARPAAAVRAPGFARAEAGLLRGFAGLPALTAAQLSALDSGGPGADEAARVHAAQALLAGLPADERPGSFSRAVAMARRIVDARTLEELRRLDEEAGRLGLEGPRDAARALSEVEARLAAAAASVEDALAAKEVLDAFFAAEDAADLGALSAAADAREDVAGHDGEYGLMSRVKKLSRLKVLEARDPAAAKAEAWRILGDEQEKRIAVRVTALRTAGRLASAEDAQRLAGVLEGDAHWHLRREAALILGRLAPSLQGEARAAAAAALEKTAALMRPVERGGKPAGQVPFETQGLSLAARRGLEALGVDPGPLPAAAARKKLGARRALWLSSALSDFRSFAIPWLGRFLMLATAGWILALLYVIVFKGGDGVNELLSGAFVGALCVGLAFVGFWASNWMMSRGGANFKGDIPKVTFDDVLGADDAVAEMRRLRAFFEDSAGGLGAESSNGHLLIGPPGTGKSLIAAAVAGEVKIPFYHAAGSDFVEMFVGVGAQRVRGLFAKAKRHAHAIVFLDEIDAVGGARDDGGNRRNMEHDQTLNALLKEMDGIDKNHGVIVIAATNRPDSLDPALKRPGRLDVHTMVDLPDVMGREEILQHYARRVRLGPDVDLAKVAQETPGASGADLSHLVNDAANQAERRRAPAVEMRDFRAARDRQSSLGGQRSKLVPPATKLKITRHEVGHALVELALGGRLEKLTNVPHGTSGGHARIAQDEEDSILRDEEALKRMLATAYGGLAAERLFYGQGSTGPSSDGEHAARLARHMVEKLGMGRRSGLEVRSHLGMMSGMPYAPETLREIDLDVRELLDEAYRRAAGILLSRRAAVEALVAALYERETLDGDEVSAIAAAAGAR